MLKDSLAEAVEPLENAVARPDCQVVVGAVVTCTSADGESHDVNSGTVDDNMGEYSHAEKVYATTLQSATSSVVKASGYNALDSILWLATLLS